MMMVNWTSRLEKKQMAEETRRTAPVTAVVPTKSNLTGAIRVITQLEVDPAVRETVLVADGDEAYHRLVPVVAGLKKVSLFRVPFASGIHVMWNIGLELAERSGSAAAFVNDDVTSSPGAAGVLAGALDADTTLGLLCPNYDGRRLPPSGFQDVDTTCGNRYDGSGGMGGFYMVLAPDLCRLFRFDERMKWYYGDDDVVAWVRSVGRRAAISGLAVCSGNESATIRRDPPPDFAMVVERDQVLFEKKWGR